MEKLNEKQIALFKGKNFAYIATINRNGTPQLTPIWADTDGKRLIVNTQIGRVKHKNVQRDKRVAVAVFDQKDPYSYVSVNGRVVREITGRKAKDHIDFLSDKYKGVPYEDRASAERRVILIVEPDAVNAMNS